MLFYHPSLVLSIACLSGVPSGHLFLDSVLNTDIPYMEYFAIYKMISDLIRCIKIAIILGSMTAP